MSKKYLFVPILGFMLTACTTNPVSTDLTGATTTQTSITDTTTNDTSTTDTTTGSVEHLVMNADFRDATANAPYSKGVEGWTLDISPNSYAGAIKMQYSGNSITTAEYNFQGPIRIEIDWYATVNGQVVTTDPFMFSFYGLNAANEITEVEQVNNVMLLPNPGAADHQKDSFILNNTSKLIRSIKLELTTKLTASNVGVLTIEIYSY